MYDDTNEKHKKPDNDLIRPESVMFGSGLGQWSNELKPGEFISEIVCGGAKSDAYKTNTGKTVVKQKGITLDIANSKNIHYESVKNMILKQSSLESEPRFTFKWDKKSKAVKTIYMKRAIRSTINSKRMVVDNFDTLPFGHE